MHDFDAAYMRRAIEIAWRGAGWTSPNPLVGAVVVKGNRIIGEGCHEKWGEAHAERNALAACDEDPSGATMYVTLEPCCHTGKQPPCTDAVIASGIARVVVGSRDPNPLVAGRGCELLREAGVEVVEDFLREECDELNPVFFHYIQRKRPYVVSKWAMTLDGKIATRMGDARWVSNEQSRADAHEMRHRLAAIMVGKGTVAADDPLLTARRDRESKQPLRIVIDGKLTISETCNLVTTAGEVPVLIAVGAGFDETKAERLRAQGVEVIAFPGENGKVDLAALLDALGQRGIDSILVEGGGGLHEAMFRAGLVNEVVVYVAPKICGGTDAATPVQGAGIDLMCDAYQLGSPKVERFGDDLKLTYRVGEC